jgi:Flp pilus assembly pilin Flp
MRRWDGNVAIEYALLAALLVMAILSALTALGTTLNVSYFSTIAGVVAGANP